MAIIKLQYSWEHDSEDYEDSFETLTIKYNERYESFSATDSLGKDVTDNLSEGNQEAICDMIDGYLLLEEERMDSWTWDYSYNDEALEY